MNKRLPIYDVSIELCNWEIGYTRAYYDGWHNALWLGFIVIGWMDIGRNSDIW